MRVIIRWKRRPRNHRLRWLLASVVGACVLLAASEAPAFRAVVGLSRQSAGQNTAFALPEVLPADLVVSEAGFAGPAERRRVAGALKNRSGKTYTDIQMTTQPSLEGRLSLVREFAVASTARK
jgi:hypothetical protein